jgi:tetratricopeptide (TPR) repeat protein
LIQQKQNSELLIKLWDSINYGSDYVIDPYQINTWEYKFEQEYNAAIKKKEIELAFKLSIPLSYIYHSETKFKKGLPLLQNIYKNKNKLNKDQLKDVLIKLEEEYRAINNIEEAIVIRKERISNRFINNYWEIYKDCGLFEAAKKDLLQFEKIPPAYTTQRLHYYFLLGDLYMQMNQFDSSNIIYKKGLEAVAVSVKDDYRGKGIAYNLLKKLDEMPYDYIILQQYLSLKSNIDYTKKGFIPVYKYGSDTNPIFIYVKVLN